LITGSQKTTASPLDFSKATAGTSFPFLGGFVQDTNQRKPVPKAKGSRTNCFSLVPSLNLVVLEHSVSGAAGGRIVARSVAQKKIISYSTRTFSTSVFSETMLLSAGTKDKHNSLCVSLKPPPRRAAGQTGNSKSVCKDLSRPRWRFFQILFLFAHFGA